MQRRETFMRGLGIVETGLVGWFFMQALRFLLGTLYAHASSADIVLRLGMPDPAAINAVPPEVAQAEIVAIVIATLAPLLAFMLVRRPVTFVATAAAIAVGRVFMGLDDPFISALGASVAAAAALIYLAATARQQPTRFALILTLGLLLDQIVRALGQTYDPTWVESYLPVQTILSAVLFVAAVLRALLSGQPTFASVTAYSGISIWGGMSFGAMLFLQVALLGLPNAVARWSEVDYSLLAPWLVAATALPLIPEVRDGARRALTLVDVQWRGWFWLAILAILVVVGNRFNGIGAAITLVLAQLMVVLMLWWTVRPQGKETRDVTGLALVLAVIVLALLFVADFFTYEYAFVRDFEGGLAVISSLLRAMRGLGLAVMLIAASIAVIPMMDSARRVPWQRGKRSETLGGLVAVLISAALVALAVLPVTAGEVVNVDRIRVATYNLHGGYNLYFDYTLSEMADTIWESGADVVLLQEVDAGRTVSFGVDQALWLGHRLGMNVSYLATNEHLQGLAVLSRVPVVQERGVLLPSQGQQTGLQRVQIRPDEGVLDIYNTWLGLLFASDAQILANQEQDQWQQMEQSLVIIGADHPGGVVGRVVFGGTFNNTPDSQLYDQMIGVGFTDPFDGMPVEQAATLLRGNIVQARLDYLWLRNILPTGRAVLQQDASDHRLAVVELDLLR